MIGTDTDYVQILLLLAYPWAERGHRETMGRIGDHLYAEFERQGAFTRMTPLPEEPWNSEPVPHTPVPTQWDHRAAAHEPPVGGEPEPAEAAS